jgi:archaellum component FlaC
MDDTKKAVIKGAINELEEKKQQLKALIEFLRQSGQSNPQYYQIKTCESEYELASRQINEFKEILEKYNQP